MKHTIITIDIAHVVPYEAIAEHILPYIDQTLENAPLEFEDWKMKVTTEERHM